MPKNLLNLSGGFPNVNTFPFEEVRLRLKDGSKIIIEGELLDEALQYQISAGYFLIKSFLNLIILRESETRINSGSQNW